MKMDTVGITQGRKSLNDAKHSVATGEGERRHVCTAYSVLLRNIIGLQLVHRELFFC